MRANDLRPQFILVMGGAGSGKNYFISHHPVYSNYMVIDVDALKGEFGLDDAMKQMKPLMQSAFKRQVNIAHPTTGSHLKGQENKIALAHEYGYSVTLVLINTPLERAMAQVNQRALNGGHDVKTDAIINSNKRARENFEALKFIVDHSIVV